MTVPPHIRPETPADVDVIRALTEAAFRDAPHSRQTEAAIVDALRGADAMVLSLVATDADGGIMGHVVFSPVQIESGESGWYALGPISVWPQLQRQGIGTALVTDGLRRLEGWGARGCVLVGDPAFYSRFGFETDPRLTYRDVPSRFVQRLVLVPPAPAGEISFHEAFEATG